VIKIDYYTLFSQQEQRRERKKIDMWFDKKKPKNLPIGMLG